MLKTPRKLAAKKMDFVPWQGKNRTRARDSTLYVQPWAASGFLTQPRGQKTLFSRKLLGLQNESPFPINNIGAVELAHAVALGVEA